MIRCTSSESDSKSAAVTLDMIKSYNRQQLMHIVNVSIMWVWYTGGMGAFSYVPYPFPIQATKFKGLLYFLR